MEQEKPVTQLLQEWRGGNREAFDQLLSAVYAELRRLAGRQMRGEERGHTLQATALVHEAFLRLVGSEVNFKDRAHFLAVSARTMRRILVDHARAKRRDKRGGGAVRVSLDERLAPQLGQSAELLVVDDALRDLAKLDPPLAEIVELYFFGGLTLEEVGEVMSVSRATAHRQLRLATAWLARELKHAGNGGNAE